MPIKAQPPFITRPLNKQNYKPLKTLKVMSETQAPYGKVSVEALTEIVSNPRGWEMTKQAIHNAAASLVERQQCPLYTALNILDNRHAEKAKENK